MKQSTSTAEALSTLTMATLMQACGGSHDAPAQTATAVDPIEGFWQSSVALEDCSTGAPLGGFRGLTVFAAEGYITGPIAPPAGVQ